MTMARRRPATPLLTIALLALAAYAAPALAESVEAMDGQCRYSDNVARFRDSTSLLLCDRVAIHRDQPGATIVFTRRSWGSSASFSGEMSGERMRVVSLSVRGGSPVAARGTCRIFHTNGQTSVVSCLATTEHGRSYAANFMPSHF